MTEKRTTYEVIIETTIRAIPPGHRFDAKTVAQVKQTGETPVLLDIPMVAETVMKAALANVGITVKTEEAVQKQVMLPIGHEEPEA